MWRSVPFPRSLSQVLLKKSTLRSSFSSIGRLATMAKRDPCTLSNYNEWITKHTTTDLAINFQDKGLKGTVSLDIESLTDNQSKEIVLDSSFLRISDVRVNSAKSAWELKDRVEPFGSPLHVALPNGGAGKGEVLKVEIDLETTSQCTATQFLTPAQTSNKKHPYMFTQCQPIHCRSLFPCQDTPDVKSTFTYRIQSPLPVIAGGVQVESSEAEGNSNERVYLFKQDVPIPTYLYGLASGDIVTASIGPRSLVATGPEELKACQWELEQVDEFIRVAEKLVFPYQWGQYNVLVLVSSYPFGGMEIPTFSFVTPTLISGDRQNVDVIAHELSHSWSGNLVTNGSWEHMWLNEGWTVYLERRIGMAIHGEPERDFSAIIGWKALEDAVENFGKEKEEFTKLIINHDGIDPDEAFSTVPYEKGFHFLYYLERLVGRDSFDKFIVHYFTKWSRKSLDSFEFKDTFMSFFNQLGDDAIKDKVATIDWNTWFYKPGLPPKPDFDTSRVDVCYKLAEKWKQKDFTPSPEDVKDMTGNQKLVFLETVEKFENSITPEQSHTMGQVYSLTSSQNVELKTAYYNVALRAKDTSAYAGIAELLGQVGRMKFVRPLFRALNKVDRSLAVSTFEKNRDFYHPICRGMVEKDLGLA